MQELPTKEDFDQWSKKFNTTDPRKALSEEEQFLRMFVPGSLGAYVGVAMFISIAMTFFVLYLIIGDFDEEETKGVPTI